jgi:prevent-host-death family protein
MSGTFRRRTPGRRNQRSVRQGGSFDAVSADLEHGPSAGPDDSQYIGLARHRVSEQGTQQPHERWTDVSSRPLVFAGHHLLIRTNLTNPDINYLSATSARRSRLLASWMTVIPQRELRNDISSVLRRVQQGEHFTITVNGRPMAELGPLRGNGVQPAGLDAVLARTPVDDRWAAELQAARDDEHARSRDDA